MTVTDSVWCANPATLNSSIAAYGLRTEPANATLVIKNAPSVKVARRELSIGMPAGVWRGAGVDDRHAGVLLERRADQSAEDAPQVCRKKWQPREQRDVLEVPAAHL